jgi:hypothetical protein
VGPRAGLDRCGKSRRTGIRSPDRPALASSILKKMFVLWLLMEAEIIKKVNQSRYRPGVAQRVPRS